MGLSYLLALAAGLVLPIQVAFNSKLTSFSGSPIIASLCSFVVGTLALTVYSFANPNVLQKASQAIWSAPLYAWLGGLIGSFYIVTSLVVTPKLGLALTLCLVVAGQLGMSILIDHFGWFGFVVKSFTWTKGLGLIMVLIGIILIKFR